MQGGNYEKEIFYFINFNFFFSILYFNSNFCSR